MHLMNIGMRLLLCLACIGLSACGCDSLPCVYGARFIVEYPEDETPVAIEVCRDEDCFVVDERRLNHILGWNSAHDTEAYGIFEAGVISVTFWVSRPNFVPLGTRFVSVTVFSATDEIASKEWSVETERSPNGCDEFCVRPTEEVYR